MSETPRAMIMGIHGATLTPEEHAFIEQTNPLGFILFSRNCIEPEQIRILTRQLIDAVPDTPRVVPILVDQEGGRVARLKPPYFYKAPPAQAFYTLFTKNPELAERAAYLNAQRIAHDLLSVGITMNCAPVADLLFPETHDVIGDRSFGVYPEQVIPLASATAKGLQDAGVLPIMKHIPGHGRAIVDSHKELPTVTTPKHVLEATDFSVFQQLSSLPWAMTAHVRYQEIDAEPATFSAPVVQLIRETIGFEGILLTDDLSMQALSGDYASRTQRAIEAGCDVVLHCNGKMDEMQQVAEAAPFLSRKQWKLIQSIEEEKEKNKNIISINVLEEDLQSIFEDESAVQTTPKLEEDYVTSI